MKMIPLLSKEGSGVVHRHHCHPPPLAPPPAEEGNHLQSRLRGLAFQPAPRKTLGAKWPEGYRLFASPGGRAVVSAQTALLVWAALASCGPQRQPWAKGRGWSATLTGRRAR
jgi:hypothetical protein